MSEEEITCMKQENIKKIGFQFNLSRLNATCDDMLLFCTSKPLSSGASAVVCRCLEAASDSIPVAVFSCVGAVDFPELDVVPCGLEKKGV